MIKLDFPAFRAATNRGARRGWLSIVDEIHFSWPKGKHASYELSSLHLVGCYPKSYVTPPLLTAFGVGFLQYCLARIQEIQFFCSMIVVTSFYLLELNFEANHRNVSSDFQQGRRSDETLVGTVEHVITSSILSQSNFTLGTYYLAEHDHGDLIFTCL